MNNNKGKSWFFEKNKIGKHLVRSNKERRINTKRNSIKKEKKVITTNLEDIKKANERKQ